MNHLRRKQGFTLIELLVVIAITAIMFGLIFGPLIQSFNLTRQANTLLEAQDAARLALEQMTRELGDAVAVFDNTNLDPEQWTEVSDDFTTTPSDFTTTPSYKRIVTNTPIALPQPDVDNLAVDITPAPLWASAKIDFLLPDNTLQDPNQPTGVLQPLTPDIEIDSQGGRHLWIVRYFIGLRDPSQRYS